jgi:hypothetical protein
MVALNWLNILLTFCQRLLTFAGSWSCSKNVIMGYCWTLIDSRSGTILAKWILWSPLSCDCTLRCSNTAQCFEKRAFNWKGFSSTSWKNGRSIVKNWWYVLFSLLPSFSYDTGSIVGVCYKFNTFLKVYFATAK